MSAPWAHPEVRPLLWIEELLTSLPGGQLGFLISASAFIGVVAYFLDFFEIAFINISLLAPVTDKLGSDLVGLAC